MKFVHISDTHGMESKLNLPDADCLIMSGDFLNYGTAIELIKFNAWLGVVKSKFKHIVVVAGNHDRIFEQNLSHAKSLLTNATHYLQDEEATLEGIRIYGSPWQPAFCNWAFNLPRGDYIKKKWDLIPDGIDILVTHGPPYGIRDYVKRANGMVEHLGCKKLLKAVMRVRPKYHLFGHIHYSNGISDNGNTMFINSAICNESYNPIQSFHMFEITKE